MDSSVPQLGQLFASLICRRTSTFNGNASWRLPFGLFYIIPSTLLILLWFVPESVLMHRSVSPMVLDPGPLRRSPAFPSEASPRPFRRRGNPGRVARASMSITVDRGRFVEVFKGVNLGRTLITVGTNVFLQITGQNFVSNYGTIFIESLRTINAFTVTVINSVANIVVVLAVMLMADKVGRKPLLIVGAIIQTGALFAMGGLGISAAPSLAARKGITAMVSVFGAGYSIGWAPLAHVIAAEIPSVRLRDFTYGLASLVNIVIQFAVSFSIPYLLDAPYADLQSKVGFIFWLVCGLCDPVFLVGYSGV
ncbi:hypothetical protein UA08_06713 [Talaromyces atroroseus]|uniref:Major facilitator superfamily (MFS) profile domain-containing protein n=1 Tax=Talaromyces atroroseus TaxID=1441469 RepID=A0A225AFI2_TALAT|nr:hypothetical protein UA08_06713 [Talaromyces atroroseus]OKL57883.1 hypothetical protein UA08_06713 [Talaromyces atroroseus]